MADTGGYAPAWQTEDLAEEWIERSASSASASGNHSGSSSSPTTTHKSFDSTKHVARASGYQGNSNINSSSGMRIVSGHTTFPSPHPHPSSVSQSHQSTSKKQSSVNVTYDAAPSPPTSHRSGSVSSGSGRSMTIPIPAHDGRSIGDTSTIPAGTFLVKPENEDIAPVGGEGVAAAGLKRNPFVAGGGDIGGAAADGGLFQRLELERLFDPPREPVVVGGSRLQAEEPVEQGDVDEERQNALPIMMGSPAGTTDQHSTIPLRRTSHSYVPVRPSRLSNSMTPPSANSSMVSSSSSSPSSGGGDPAQAGLSRTDSALRYDSAREDPDEGYAGAEYDSQSDSSVEGGQQESSLPWLRKSRDDGEPMTRQPRRFSGEEGSMRDVEFTFSPSPIRKRPSAQTLVTHTSRSVSSSVSPATKTTTTTAAGGKKLPFRLFQRQVDSEGWDTIQSRDLIERITVGGTPLKDLVRRAGAGGGSPSPVHRTLSAGQRRRDSGFTADADRSSVQRGRRHRNPQLAKQWSSSSGSDGASSASGSREKLEEESEVLEERSAKRIRLSRSPSSSSGRHRYHQQVAGEYEEESPVRAEEERHAATGATQYQYSASGSEDARDQHQYHHTADSFLSASRSRASQSYTRRMQQNPEQSSSVSDVGVEDEDVANRSNGQPSVPPQGQRTSWGEKGEELLQRIRQGQGEMSEKSDTWTTSWSRSSVSAEGKQPMQEGKLLIVIAGVVEELIIYPLGLPPTPPLAVGNNKRQVIEQGQQGPYGTVTSSNSGGTASSSSTITSRYLSAGINMLEKIKERKVSDSSGTGACTDGDARTETQESRCGSEEGNKNGWAQERGNRPGYSGEGATVSSQSTIRGGPARQLSGAGSVDLQGSVKSRGSGSSTRSSFVASLGKGAAPTNLRTIAESPSVSVTYTRSEQDVAAQPGRPIQQIPRVPPVQQEDMNRYISSTSTANTATTAVSTSFVKHRGPPAPAPHGRAQGVRTIGLNDIPQIPRQVGNMVFDPVRGWVKATRNARNADQEVSSIRVDESKSSSAESMDIFAGMESLRDEESTPQPEVPYRLEDTQRRGQNLSPVLEASMSQAIQEETVYGVESEVSRRGLEQQIDSQRQPRDSSDGRIYNPAVSSSAIDDFAYLSINRETAEATSSAVPTKDEFENGGNEKTPQKPVHKRPELHETVSAPTPLQTDPVLYTPAVRSILKTGSTEMSAVKAVVPTTPLSAIKIVSASEDSARRSVSFSDGQTHGKIREHKARHAGGASRRQRNWTAVAPEDDIFNSQDGSSGGEQSQLIIQPSVRSKRIQNMLTGLQGDTETPSKTSISGHSRKLSLLSDPSPDPVSRNATSEMSFNTRVRGTRRNKADATFLTECSFGVAHDKLVELITEVQPFEPHWDQLTKIDLSKRGVDSVARLKEFCPDLDEANLNNNHISYLSGLPASLRRLHISSNKLTNVSSVDYLANLQYLDVSHNQIDSVNALSCLKHLRELRLDYNQVQDLKDIMGIDSLVKLSCKGNAIKTVDFSAAQWPDMECLDLSRNQIAHVEGLESLKALTTLNLDHNRLSECNPAIPAQSLRALRLSHNRLKTVDMSKFPRLRSLYADGNQIRTLVRSSKHSSVRLEYLSLRDQDVSDLDLSYADLRDVKRLYISGNRLSKQFFPTRPLYSLVYLEAAACSLSEWPEGFGQRVPNLRILNMNYNFIENLSGIEGLQGLRKLMMIGCRLGEERSSSVLRSVRQIGTLEEIDLRMNPLNLNFYLPLILNEASPTTIIYPAEANSSESVIQALSSTDRWAGMDDKFRQLLPDRWYFKRLVYRGALKLACDTINVIDGIHLTQGEMRKAIELMEDAALRGKTAA
ncbi:hypothetical protein QFC22_004867 [Naganishia vaughanmartiniae]|uniref:Uncharacterized protein n=1 Tax=Naganishia vaughanmartiniae TaxID=1424756 RepID=A0ACC2WXB5_9TREE|nr:hypothetical protein QFC22_004867 [Naganishia vaughanmartiniae]